MEADNTNEDLHKPQDQELPNHVDGASSPICESCLSDENQSKDAEWYCTDCKKHMCQACCNIHTDFGDGCHVEKLEVKATDADNLDEETGEPTSNAGKHPQVETTTTEVVNPPKKQKTNEKNDDSVITAESNQNQTPISSEPNSEERNSNDDIANPPPNVAPINLKLIKTILVKKSASMLRKVEELSSIAIDPNNGEMYTVSHDSKLVIKFDADGNFVRKFAAQGPSKLKEPWDVAVLQNSKVVVSDSGDKTVKIYSDKQRLLKTLSNLSDPRGVAVDSALNIYVSDKATQSVYIYSDTQDGQMKTITPSTVAKLVSPDFLAVNSKNDIIISDCGDDSIKAFASSSNQLLFQHGSRGSRWNKLTWPFGITVDISGQMFIADSFNDRVIVLNPDGSFKQILLAAIDGLSKPRGLALAKDGKLVIATGDGQIVIYEVKKKSGFCSIL